MPRLGELLVSAGVLAGAQLDRALRAQVLWGARLGTNLIELGFIDLDTLSTFLGRQHGLPAALARHFERVDKDLQRTLHPDLAEQYTCVPLVRVGENRDVVIASTNPLTKKVAARIADELAVEPKQLIVAVAGELRIRYQLERVYNVGRPARFMRSPGNTIPPFPQFEISDADESVDADDMLEVDETKTTTPVLGVYQGPGAAALLHGAGATKRPPPTPALAHDLSIDVDMDQSGLRPMPSPQPELPVRAAAIAPALPYDARRADTSIVPLAERPTLEGASLTKAAKPVVVPTPPAANPAPMVPPTPPPAGPPEISLDGIPDALASEEESGGLAAPIHPRAAAMADLDAISAEVDDALSIPTAVEIEESSGRRERRRYVRTLDNEADRASLGRIAIRRVASGVNDGDALGTKTLGEATRAIRRATDRDKIAELCIDTMFRFAPSCAAANLLVVRGIVVTAWKGFVRDGSAPAEFSVQLDQPGLISKAVQRTATVRAPVSELSPIDQLLMVSLAQKSGELVIVPVTIAKQVMCVIASVTENEQTIATCESVAAAAGAAFARLMRDASR